MSKRTKKHPQASEAPAGKEETNMNELPTDIVAQAEESAVTPQGASRGVVYLASSMTTYQTTRYDAMIEHVRTAFPDAELLPARDLYTSSAHWLATWPNHLKRLTATVFFADTDGTIGKGVAQEIEDSLAAGIAVYFIYDDGGMVPHEAVSLILLRSGMDWRRYMHVEAPSRPAAPLKDD
jgi:hypothetical protein